MESPRPTARLGRGQLKYSVEPALATSKGNVRVELSITNLTDRENACCVDEVYFATGPGERIETQTTFDYWMGITPSLQILWSF